MGTSRDLPVLFLVTSVVRPASFRRPGTFPGSWATGVATPVATAATVVKTMVPPVVPVVNTDTIFGGPATPPDRSVWPVEDGATPTVAVVPTTS